MKGKLILTNVAAAVSIAMVSFGAQAVDLKDAAGEISAVPAKADFTISNMNGETQLQGQYGTQEYSDLLGGLKKGQTGVVYSQWQNSGSTSPSLLTALQNGQNLTNEGTIWVLGGGEYGNYAEGMGNTYPEFPMLC